jgi:23S rRNA (cytidine2498-2'-O)-methyltransferase
MHDSDPLIPNKSDIHPVDGDKTHIGMTAYLAAPDFVANVRSQLQDIEYSIGNLLICRGERKEVYFCQDIWSELELIEITSISDAARQLKARHPRWYQHPFHLHRRSQLITEKLPKVRIDPIVFPPQTPMNTKPVGVWTLINENLMAASIKRDSPFTAGIPNFVEDKINPPSRAYLKLWEVFTRLGVTPKPGEFCLDLGASPGGWTWVLDSLGCEVLAIDRSPLADNLQKSSRITWQKGNAFGLLPQQIDRTVDWLFSDLICYPEKLLEYIQLWLSSGKCRHFVCTIKFQGQTNLNIVKSFLEIPGSQIVHLHHNKHELTWLLIRSESPSQFEGRIES